MIRALKYSNGGVKKSSLSNLGAYDRIWIDLHFPSDNEIKQVSKITGIYLQDLQRILKNIDELPRIFNRTNYSMVIVRALNKKLGYSPFGIYVGKHFIVTLHSKKVVSLEELFESVSGDQGREFFSNGIPFIFYRIMSSIIKKFQSQIDILEDEVDELEDIILNNKLKSPDKIFDLKQVSMILKRALITNRDIIEMISEHYSKFLVTKNNENRLSELRTEVNQSVSVAEIFRERLTGTIDMYMSSISNRLNDTMKSFTVIASLLLLPMLISGIWGMNFANIPFSDLNIGFYIPLAIMLISVAVMVTFFRVKKWM